MSASIENFNLYLKKQYSTKGKKSQYYFKLCCPEIVNLRNDCSRIMVNFRIKPCFYIGSTMFELDTSNEIIFNYNNITVGIKKKASVIENGMGSFICVLTDQHELNNELCIMNICIPVKPNCFSKEMLNKPVSFSKIGEWVCYE